MSKFEIGDRVCQRRNGKRKGVIVCFDFDKSPIVHWDGDITISYKGWNDSLLVLDDGSYTDFQDKIRDRL